MDEIQKLIIEAYGSIYLELHINWKTVESYFVVSHVRHKEVFENIRDAKESFDLMKKKAR